MFPSDLSLKQCAAETRTLVVRMVAAHMKYASPELWRRNSEASHGKLPSSGWANHSSVSPRSDQSEESITCAAPLLSSSVQMMRPRRARCCGLGDGVNNNNNNKTINFSAVKRSVGFTIGFHNHGEGPY